MNIDKHMHPVVRAIIDAAQRGDKLAWLSYFTANARLLRNGKPCSLFRYVTVSVGSDRFHTINAIGHQGTSVHGQWLVLGHGCIATTLKFQIDSAGKCYQLEIEQAKMKAAG